MVAETFKQQLLKNGKRTTAINKAGDDDTESDSDFDSMSLVKKTNHGKRVISGYSSAGKRRKVRLSNFLEEHLTLGELAGLVPQSLLVNVNFEKFSRENGFEPIDQT